MIWPSASIWALLALTGLENTTQVTPSLHGGVVSDPLSRKYDSFFGSKGRMSSGSASLRVWPLDSDSATSGASAGFSSPS